MRCSFCGIASSLLPFSHFLCDEALQWMNNIPLERGSLLLSGYASSVVKAKHRSEVLSSHLRSTEKKEREEMKVSVREQVNRLGKFYSIICSLQEVALSHISIMCLFWLAALSLEQTLVAEDVNGREFNFALEQCPSKWMGNYEFLQRSLQM